MSFYAQTYDGELWYHCHTKIMSDTERPTVAEAAEAALKSPDYAPNLIIHIVTKSIGTQPIEPRTRIWKTIQHVEKYARLHELFRAWFNIKRKATQERYWIARQKLIDAIGDIGDIGNDVLEEIKLQETELSDDDEPVATKNATTVSRSPAVHIETDFSLLDASRSSTNSKQTDIFAYPSKERVLRSCGITCGITKTLL